MCTITQYTAMTAVLALSPMLPLSVANASVNFQAESITSDPPPTEGMTSRELLEYHNEPQRRLIAEMWERGQPEKDRGGMITERLLAPPGRRFVHPLPPDPLRRDAFDKWRDRIAFLDTVDPEELERTWQHYVDQINNIIRDRYRPAYEMSAETAAESGPGPRNHATAVMYENMIATASAAIRDARRAEERLFHMLASLDQGRYAMAVESWRLYRQWERTPIFSIQVSGAEVHLSRLLESIAIEWPSRHIRHAYETEIASLAERRADYVLNTAVKLMHLHASGFYNEHNERYDPISPEGRAAREEFHLAAQPMRRQRWQHQQRMYAVNARYVALLSLLLDQADAELVYDTFMYAAFPEHFPDQYDLRAWFDELLDDQPVSRDLRRSIGELRQTYMAARLGIDQSLVRTIHRHEQHFMLERSRSRQEQQHQEREIESQLRRRYENAVIFAVRLVELLEKDERFDWIKDDLEELLETDLTRRW